MRAMVLAAGRGERMRPLTDTTPKPLLEVGGKPLIVHLLGALERAGIRDVVVNLSWLGERIRAALGAGDGLGVRIAYSDEGPTALETGGGIVRALPLLGAEPFLVVSGDLWTDFDFRSLALAAGAGVGAGADADADAEIVLVPNPSHYPQGDFALTDDRVIEGGAERLTYANIGLYRPEPFRRRAPGRFPLVEVLRELMAAGRLRGRVHHGAWVNVGTPGQLAALDTRLRAGARG
ncbi:MAG: N-acetylmuramate alpha-1-phosphate uridylyltransferase MurU [Steroidobacteraceae bacterium]